MPIYETPVPAPNAMLSRDNDDNDETSDVNSCDSTGLCCFLASISFLVTGITILLSITNFTSDKKPLSSDDSAVSFYLAAMFLLCGFVTATQSYFCARNFIVASVCGNKRGIGNRRIRTQRTIQNDDDNNERADSLPQWVTRLIHEQLQHLNPGRELIINVPDNYEPPPYDLVVVQRQDAPPPTYVEAIALLSHDRQQQDHEKPTTTSASTIIDMNSVASPSTTSDEK